MRMEAFMKFIRRIMIVGAACMGLSMSCVHNAIVDPVEVAKDVEIAYTPAPITKAYAEFDHSYVFESAAYYLAPASPFESFINYGEKCINYVPSSTVSCVNNVWRMASPYYWPKDGGTLTFFSWSLNKSTLDFNTGSTASAEIKPELGVHLKDFDITVDGDIDFIVADIAADQTKNLEEYYVSGVPTLFRHKLASVKFTAETDADYSASKAFYIRSIEINGIARTAEYQQGEVITTSDPWTWTTVDRWTVNGTYDVAYFKYSGNENSYATDGVEVTADVQDVKGEQYFYIPETFDGSETITIWYQIVDLKTGIVEDVTVEVPLKTVGNQTGVVGDSFDVGKIYTINLRFRLDEITWDPSVEDWAKSDAELVL